MMIMGLCNIQTNEHDLQAKTYPNICAHHKLHNDNENKIPVFPVRRIVKHMKLLNCLTAVMLLPEYSGITRLISL